MNLRQSGPFIGVGGMATVLFLYAYSAIVLPSVLTAVLLPLLWVVLFGLSLAWFTTHPYRVVVLPLIGSATWFVAMLT